MQTNAGQRAPANTPQKNVPSNARATRVTEATRVPMSLPHQRLAAPDLPGYHLHWHLGANVPRALKAGYTFVDEEEVEVEQKGVANSAADSGSTDMGTRISIAAGGTVSETDLEPERLYLMKLPEEWWAQDMAGQAQVSENIAQSLRSGDIGVDKEDPRDRAHRSIKAGQDLFWPQGQKVGRPR